MKLALGFLLLLFAAIAPAATLTATSGCSVNSPGDSSVHFLGTTSCSVANPFGNASAGVSFTTTFPSTPFAPLTLSVDGSASAQCSNCNGAGGYASGTYTLELTTPGPVRTGYATFVTHGGGDGVVDAFGGGWTFDMQTGTVAGDLTGGCGGFGADFICDGGPVSNPQYPFPTLVTLGTTFMITETAQVSADASDSYGGGGGSTGGTISIQFFDANNEPVQILDASAPEPATWTLAALPLALLFWRFRKSLP